MTRLAKLAALAASSLAALLSPTFASDFDFAFEFDGLSREVLFINNADDTVVEMRISDVDDPDYGDDVIPDRIIEAGNSAIVSPNWTRGYCLHDMKVDYASGRIVKISNINLCDAAAIAVDEAEMVVLDLNGDTRQNYHNASW